MPARRRRRPSRFELAIARKLIGDPKDLAAFCKLSDGLANGAVTEVAGKPITFTLMAHLRSRRCEIVDARTCTRVGCSEVAPRSSSVMDKFDFPCSKCSEDFYVENYGRLTQTEWGFLAPQVQEYNKTLLAQYGVDPADFLIREHVRLMKLMDDTNHLQKQFSVKCSTLGSSQTLAMDLNFLHPVQEIVITIRKVSEMGSGITNAKQPGLPANGEILELRSLELNAPLRSSSW